LRLTDVYPEREKKTRPYLEALALFDLVICVSKEARDDLRHFWKEYSCDATDTCVEPWPGELEGAEASPDSNTSGNFILYVSSFHGRKAT